MDYYLLQSDILYYSTYKIANLRVLEKSINNVKIEGTISLAFRIVIGNPGDSILLGGIALLLE